MSLSDDLDLIREIVASLDPDILHLGASTELVTPQDLISLKRDFPEVKLMRSIPVLDMKSVDIAKAYDLSFMRRTLQNFK